MFFRRLNPLRSAAREPAASPLNPRRALQILGITFTTGLTSADVKKAYTRQSLRCHPDINPRPDAKEQFQQLTEALRVALQAVRQATPIPAGTDNADGHSKPPPTSEEALRGALDEHLRAKRRLDPTRSVSDDELRHAAFYTPTIAEVTSVCQQEAQSMRQIQRFCNELPATLCGHQRMLFDCVGSADPHCVAPLADSMERFAKHLPLIVRRVIKLREKFSGRRRPTAKRIVNGFGSSGATGGGFAQDAGGGRGEQIEDMPLKPLVLIGALVFTDSRTDEKLTPSDKGTVAVTPGVQCTKELICVLHITDSIDDISAKMSAWELASFHRLRLELSISSAASLLFTLLELPEQQAKPTMTMRRGVVAISKLVTSHATSVSFHVPPALSVDLSLVEKVGLTVQRLSCLLCQSPGSASTNEQLTESSVPVLLAQLRQVCKEHDVLSRIEGLITLVWDEKDPHGLIQTPEELVAEDPGDSAGTSESTGFAVRRHPRCCSADAIQFAVSVRLSTSLVVFLSRLKGAFVEIAKRSAAAVDVLPNLQLTQQSLRRDEFIPVEPGLQGGASDAAASSNKGSRFAHRYEFMNDEFEPPADDGTSFVHRRAIRCISRVCNMEQTDEAVFWQRLYNEREYLAGQASVLRVGLNVFFECQPYNPSTMPATVTADDILGQWPLRPWPEDAVPGWVGDSDDGDQISITRRELASQESFHSWLVDVVASCKIADEARGLLSQNGIGYVVREPHLPPHFFLSFVRLFCASTAARSTLESHARRDGCGNPVTSTALGFTIHIGTECDVRNGGNWVIPWNVDPSLLVSLLAPLSSSPELTE